MKKRIMSVILVILLVLSMALSLAACGQTTAEQALRMGVWLSLVADSFGMEAYSAQEPYFAQVTSANPYFAPFQLAAEWEIVAPSDSINESTPLTWKDVVVSLVNAGGFLPYDSDDSEKMDYATEHFDKSIRRYWGDRYITLDEAMPLLEIAQEQWANKTFTEKIERLELADGVVDLSSRANLDYVRDDDKIYMTKEQAEGLKPGDVYYVPGIPGESEDSIERVSAISYENGMAVITNDSAFAQSEASQYVNELQIQETEEVDFNNIAAIYDEAGNVIYSGGREPSALVSRPDSYYPSTLTARRGMDAQPSELGFFDNAKGELSIPIKLSDKQTLNIKLNFSSSSVKLGGTLSTTAADSKYRNVKKEISLEAGVEDISFTKDIDFSWGKLHHATVKADYKVVVAGGYKVSMTNDVGKNIDKNGHVKQHLGTVLSEYGNAMRKLASDAYDTKYADKTVYICRVSLLNGGVGSLDFVIKGKVSLSGEVKIVLEYAGSRGIEINSSGNIRYISSGKPSAKVTAEGKIEVTMSPGFEIRALKVFEAFVGAELGAGFSGKFIVRLVDGEDHLLFTGDGNFGVSEADELEKLEYLTSSEDILALAESEGATWKGYKAGSEIKISPKLCFEWSLYPIVRVKASVDVTVFGKKILSLEGSKEFIGSKNTLAKGHIDGGTLKAFADGLGSDNLLQSAGALLGVGASCSYEFKPWDKADELLDEKEDELGVDFDAEDSDPILYTDAIVLSESRVFLKPGEELSISVKELPKDYSLSDLVVESENDKIATLNPRTGKIIAGDTAGTVQIRVYIKDTKFQAYCAVTVEDNSTVAFTGLH